MVNYKAGYETRGLDLEMRRGNGGLKIADLVPWTLFYFILFFRTYLILIALTQGNIKHFNYIIMHIDSLSRKQSVGCGCFSV